jgi:hypothetical protein
VTPRRRSSIAALALGTLLLAGCGSSGGIARVNAPQLPDTTAPPTASPSASPSATPQPTATPTATPTTAPTSTPAEGGVIRVPPDDSNGDNTVAADLYPSSGFANCASSGSAGYGACPVTSRLGDRLNQHPIRGAEQLCRCQNRWQGVNITAPPVLPALNTYTVEVDLQFGGGTVSLDVVVIRTSDGWYADDIRCHGAGSGTSIYSASPPPC